MSFLDVYSAYHQIPLYGSNQEYTSFKCILGNYCYKAMPFGIKNVNATYQHAMTKICTPFLGRLMGVYIDDVVIINIKPSNHIYDLYAIF